MIWHVLQQNFTNEIIVLLQFIKAKVLLLSSKHKFIKIEKSCKYILETILYYDKIKFGVDMTDQMARKYSVKSNSRR